MSDLERLHKIIETLRSQQVRALVTLLDANERICDEEFVRRLADAPEEDLDDKTIARILAAEAEQGEMASHGDVRRRFGL